jgi:hypothetical protein
MPMHESCKGSLFPVLDKALKELPVRQSCPVLQEHGFAKLLDDLAHLASRHILLSPSATARPLPIICRTTAV